jgi:dihydroxy-acid dehydratase
MSERYSRPTAPRTRKLIVLCLPGREHDSTRPSDPVRNTQHHSPHYTNLLNSKGLKYSLPCIGDGRQSGTSGSPSILNASPEAAENGNLAILRDGDMLRVDLNKRRVDMLISEEEIQKRGEELLANGGYQYVESHTPYQDFFRREVGPLSEGMVFRRAVQYQRIAQKFPSPRDNH